MFNDAALALEEIPSRQDPQRGVRRPLTSYWSLLISSRSDTEPSCRCRSTRLCWLNISRPAFRRASKARINKGEASTCGDHLLFLSEAAFSDLRFKSFHRSSPLHSLSNFDHPTTCSGAAR